MFSVFIINIEYIVIHFIFSFNFTVYINFHVFLIDFSLSKNNSSYFCFSCCLISLLNEEFFWELLLSCIIFISIFSNLHIYNPFWIPCIRITCSPSTSFNHFHINVCLSSILFVTTLSMFDRGYVGQHVH